MNELSTPTIKPAETVIEIVDQKQHEKQYKFEGTVNPHPGHTLYEFNTTTGEIVKAKFKARDIILPSALPDDMDAIDKMKASTLRKTVIMNDGCMYASALNIKNAEKKFRKIMASFT
jgi:hypothetical protein